MTDFTIAEYTNLRLECIMKVSIIMNAIQMVEPTGFAKVFLIQKGLMDEYTEFATKKSKEVIRSVQDRLTEQESEYIKAHMDEFIKMYGKTDDEQKPKSKRGRKPKQAVGE